jgi:hypothetical protein
MWRRGIILTAVVTYLVVTGCVIWPTNAPARTPAEEPRSSGSAPATNTWSGLPYRGVVIQLQRVDWIDKYEQSIDDIAALGADTVEFTIDTRQENGESERIYLDMRMTPTPEMLARLIKKAKSKNLRVILMPIVLLDNPRGSEWRGTLKPGSWEEWFRSYREMITHFAWIAEENHADVLVVGSELVSSEPHVDQWDKTINEVRKLFHGRLTYSSNWDHYREVKFWDRLDMVGMNSYWKFGKEDSNPDPSVDHIVKRWREIQSDLLPFVKATGKPLLFIEIGWFSQSNVAYEPWDYTKTVEEAPINLELQKKLYEGFFKAWHGEPLLGGFSVWEWPADGGGTEDKGYTPKGKPAEKVLREWLAKPWK